MELRSLAAGLWVRRLGPADVEQIRPVVGAALEASQRLPPLGLVADIATLLAEHAVVLGGVEVPGLRLRRYEDRVVSPLLTHRLRLALRDAWTALDRTWRPRAVAVLAEVACLSNDREARLLALPSYRQRIADALYGGIARYARGLDPMASDLEKGKQP